MENNNNNNKDIIIFHKMVLIYNAINNGWSVKKINNKFIFTKLHQGEEKYFSDNYLSTFMKEQLYIK